MEKETKTKEKNYQMIELDEIMENEEIMQHSQWSVK